VDNYSGNPGVNAAEIERQERRIAAAADVCFATSRPLAERLAAMGGDVRCVPNVADFEHFSAAREIPAEFSGIPRPIVGYMGNLAAYKVDLEILAEIAVRRPEWSLVVIGPVNGGYRGGGIGRLRALRNVRLFGPKRYEEIPAYLRGLDVGLIPFRRNRVTDYSLPLKVFEYLAAGRPVVSSPLLSLTAEPLEDVVHYASTGEEFVAAIERSLAEDGPAQAQMRREVAARYSWEKRFPEIIAQVEEVLEGKEAACRG
jgi:glycosyltransferase involved in cell wall biosynthesis